jgi:hypothetical protein
MVSKKKLMKNLPYAAGIVAGLFVALAATSLEATMVFIPVLNLAGAAVTVPLILIGLAVAAYSAYKIVK